MNRRSLVDYLANPDLDDPAEAEMRTRQRLGERLDTISKKLAGIAAPAERAPPAEVRLSSQIESILRRHDELVADAASHRVKARPAPARMMVEPPPLAEERSSPVEQPVSTEFAGFVEAVQWIGRAARRYVETPQPGASRRSSDVQDMEQMAAVMRETVRSFQAMTAELAAATGHPRQPGAEPARRAVEPPESSRRVSRDDAELFRLQDDLDELRERLGAFARRRRSIDY